jgi:ADP-heptose:LPS heptosyltransferase
MSNWIDVKNVLVVRLDNMGDLLMSAPAIRALKETFHCRITVLTSSMAKGIAHYIDSIDEVIEYNVPWVKTSENVSDSFFQMVDHLKSKKFDAAVIFTVFSQNPLPAAMLTVLAEIPKRLAYCRENPYLLLTDWIPDQEPYSFIRHQVQRDLDLVRQIGAQVNNDEITILSTDQHWQTVQNKLSAMGVDPLRWILFHPGVSEEKRAYPVALWRSAAKRIINELKYDIVITGTASEQNLADQIRTGIKQSIFSLAGKLSLDEFVTVIKHAPLVISVNTVTVHIASATKTKIIVLYALTNPQHTPWKTLSKILTFPVRENLQSRNEVLRFIQQTVFKDQTDTATPENILEAAESLLMHEEYTTSRLAE